MALVANTDEGPQEARDNGADVMVGSFTKNPTGLRLITAGTVSQESLNATQEVQSEPIALSLPPTDTWYARRGKRLLDLLIATVSLLVLVPLLLLAWALLRVSLGPGVVIRQRRCGFLGEDFELFKFRTMLHSKRAEAAEYSGEDRRQTHKSDADPRHTAVGRILRRFSIDELPQLVNVLRGDMSIVGPRPELSTIADAHSLRSHPRHLVRPGLTGEWQISVRNTGALLHESVAVDVPYLTRISLARDLRIILSTFSVFLGGGGR